MCCTEGRVTMTAGYEGTDAQTVLYGIKKETRASISKTRFHNLQHSHRNHLCADCPPISTMNAPSPNSHRSSFHWLQCERPMLGMNSSRIKSSFDPLSDWFY